MNINRYTSQKGAKRDNENRKRNLREQYGTERKKHTKREAIRQTELS